MPKPLLSFAQTSHHSMYREKHVLTRVTETALGHPSDREAKAPESTGWNCTCQQRHLQLLVAETVIKNGDQGSSARVADILEVILNWGD
jgi:hypothetical protein